MPSFLQEELGIALSGTYWDIDNFRLWESTQTDTILFMPLRPELVINSETERYQVGLTAFHQWSQGVDKTLSGSLSFVTTLTSQLSWEACERLKQQWTQELKNRGYLTTEILKFAPLPIRNVNAQILIDPSFGRFSESTAANLVNVGETSMFLLELTEKGTQRWVQAIELRSDLPGMLRYTYEYPQMLPSIQAIALVKGKRTFNYLASVLTQQEDGSYVGSQDQIDAIWEPLIRDRSIELQITSSLPSKLGETQQNLVKTLSEQAQHYLLDLLFTSNSNLEPSDRPEHSEQGSTFKLRWHKQADATDLKFELSVNNGWNWLQGSLGIDCTTLFQPIDVSYLNTVYIEQSFPVSITVQGSPLLRTVAFSWSTDSGKLPEAIIFSSEGGKRDYVMTSRNPDQVTVFYQARITFTPPKWPILEIKGSGKVAQGGNQILLRPSDWIKRLMIHLFIREANHIKPAADLLPGDSLVVNVTYKGPHLTSPIKESSRITPIAPIQFVYLQDPQGRPSQLQLSVMGTLNGQMLRLAAQSIHADETDVFLLVNRSTVQLVSRESVVAEDDELAQQLLAGQLRPAIANSP